MPHVYGNGTNSSVGTQFRTDYYHKKALVEAAKEMYFGQMADVRSMPKNMGKTIKQYHYLPLLDDRNINDQGIDANGVAVGSDGAEAVYVIEATAPAGLGGQPVYFVGRDSNATYATALTNAQAEAEGKYVAYFLQRGYNTLNDTYAEFSTGATAGSPDEAGWVTAVVDNGAAASALPGNLYGSSKDVGVIASKIPALSETGGRVNRVGFKRIELEGTIDKFGFFDEYTQESLDFDTDAELEMHITQEAVKAANEITEDQLQIDLLNGAGVVRLTGGALSVGDLDGNASADKVIYDDLVKLSIELDNNRTPKNTRVISGSRMTDTRVVNAARYMYIGSELQPSVMKMVDYHNAKAFIPVAQYANAGNVARGEFGAVDNFRLIVVPEMMHWEAAGAVVTDPDGATFQECRFGFDGTNYRYNVYPMLVVGDGSFTTIGFQTDGKTVKFKITHKRPGPEIANRDDPYGEVGFYSIKWYYGTMILRPERLALVKTVAEQ